MQNCITQLDKLLQFVSEYEFSFPDEVVKEITCYENDGRYLISNYGNVFSLCHKKWIQLKSIPDKNGYLRVNLCYNGNHYTCYVHRLVADAFIYNDNPEVKTMVHHLDGNNLNNHSSNLKFVGEIEHQKLHKAMREKKKKEIQENGKL